MTGGAGGITANAIIKMVRGGIAHATGHQNGGVLAKIDTQVARGTNNVQAGSLIVVTCVKYSPGDDPFVAGDCTKFSGTATIDTPTLDRSHITNLGGGNYLAAGIWTCLATSAGSLTILVSGALAASSLFLTTDEFTGNWGAGRLETGNDAEGAAQGSASTGNATSAGAALFIACVGDNQAGISSHTEDPVWTLIAQSDQVADVHGSSISRIVASGTTDDGSWTFGASADYVAALAVYREG